MRIIKNDVKVIGIGGFAKAGKDTFVAIAKNILQRNGYTPYRVAFADTLKDEVQEMLTFNGFNIDLYNMTPEEKEFARPLLVWWGCQRRRESPDGLYWVNEVSYNIDDDFYSSKYRENMDKTVFLVSDVRFENEANWVKNDRNGVFIHLKRYSMKSIYDQQFGFESPSKDKIYDDAPNDEERKNDPLIEAIADIRIEWENVQQPTPFIAADSPILQEIVLNTLNKTKYFIDSKLK